MNVIRDNFALLLRNRFYQIEGNHFLETILYDCCESVGQTKLSKENGLYEVISLFETRISAFVALENSTPKIVGPVDIVYKNSIFQFPPESDEAIETMKIMKMLTSSRFT
jgi:hypothetical protein